MLHYFAADATRATPVPMTGDGSPFEALAELHWLSIDRALARLAAATGDLRAELGLRRLRDQLVGAP